MNRAALLRMIAALPFLGFLKPEPHGRVTIQSNATDDWQTVGVTLRCRVNDGPWHTVPAERSGNSIMISVLDDLRDGDTIYFREA